MQTLEQKVEKSFLGKVKDNLGRIRSSTVGKIAVYSLVGVLSAGLGYGCGSNECNEGEVECNCVTGYTMPDGCISSGSNDDEIICCSPGSCPCGDYGSGGSEELCPSGQLAFCECQDGCCRGSECATSAPCGTAVSPACCEQVVSSDSPGSVWQCYCSSCSNHPQSYCKPLLSSCPY